MSVTREQAADFSPPPLLVEEAIKLARDGRWDEATETLERALAADPGDLIAWLTLAGVRGRAGDADGEFMAIQQALAIEPYYVPALLLKGNWYEGRGDQVLAATSYTHALQVAPPREQWPPQLQAELGHAQAFVENHSQGLRRHLTDKLAGLRSGLQGPEGERWDEAVSIRAGCSNPYVSNSNQLYVPRLPAIPFFAREQFPFLHELEMHTPLIRDEMAAAIRDRNDGFEPYIAYRPGEPVNQWQHLNHSSDWNAFHLWKGGQPVEENLASCPSTAALLAELSLCSLSGLCPNVFFSALAPKTRIPPHFGESNARVIAHLPLVIPDDCGIRVGFETRQWQIGETLVFDDTLEHEAWNDSDELRVVMIFDLWNPLLSESDRELASALAEATRGYTG
ncbi:MAG: aspartyl/asparaginyl beta-hydroxylase domain-containing protein [Woeseiaceae bacterium]|nr:aspartyl/asparaginyl beta-hydroxylase domain-containing protein [Woeseiaceae bacterium]